MTQASGGFPAAVIPMQSGGDIVADQTITPGTQVNQLQVILPPESREVNNPPPPYEAVASGHQTSQIDRPPSYEETAHGEWRIYV